MRILLCLLLIVPSILVAQNQTNIKAKVLDLKTQEPVVAANVFEISKQIGTITDHKGTFYLVLPKASDSITVSHIAYEPLTFAISDLKKINYTIELRKNAEFIDLVTISAKPKIDPITTNTESIVDFAVEKDYIILLTREKTKSRSLKLLNQDGQELHHLKLTDIRHIEQLTTSCMDSHFLLSEKFAYQLYIKNDSIHIAHQDPIKKYNQFIASCIDANSEYYYFDYRKKYNQLAEIRGVHKYSHQAVNFGSVGDQTNLKNLKEDQKYLDFMDNKSHDEWINLTDSHSLESFYDFWEKAALLKYNFYLPANCFVHADEKSVYILDHENHIFYKYSLNGKNIFQKSLFYSKNKNWIGKIYKDRFTEKLFTILKSDVDYILTEIDLSSGRLLPKANLDLSYFEDLQIFDDVLYFTNSGLVAGQEARILKKVKF